MRVASKLLPHVWVKEIREDKSIRQTDVERFTEALGPRYRISQSHLSKIEKGLSPLAGLGPMRMDALRQALGLSTEEWIEGTGLSIVTPDDLQPIGNSPVPPVVAPLDLPLVIPPELQQLIDEKADKPGYEALNSKKALQALTAQRAYLGAEDGPQTVDQWQEYFLSIRRWLPTS